MGKWIFYLVFLLQIITFVFSIMLFVGYGRLFPVSFTLYFVSVLLLVLAIFKGQQGNLTNCFTTLLFIVNLLLLITYLFTYFLKGFLGSQM